MKKFGQLNIFNLKAWSFSLCAILLYTIGPLFDLHTILLYTVTLIFQADFYFTIYIV